MSNVSIVSNVNLNEVNRHSGGGSWRDEATLLPSAFEAGEMKSCSKRNLPVINYMEYMFTCHKIDN